jgi:Ribonuclease G/E
MNKITIAMLILLGVGLSLQTYFIFNKLKNQETTIALLQESVNETKLQNEMIIIANQGLAADSEVIKKGMEEYNRTLNDINKNTKSLSTKLNDNNFRKLLKEELSVANKQYNDWFNMFLREMRDATIIK